MSGPGFWDERYAADPAAYGHEPNAFLAREARRIPAGGRVVALAEGYGRNALWLARCGHPVVAVDASAVAVRLLREAAAAEGLPVEAVQADLAAWFPPPCDAVVAIFAHLPPPLRARVHGAAWDALRPGGVVLIEAFTPAQLGRDSGGPKDPALLYTPELLAGDFPGASFEILAHASIDLDEGPFHQGAAEVVRLAARKPAGRSRGRRPGPLPGREAGRREF
jgi:SAM-dependent methyltransferase